jgi:asparagine synthase (glutamine-hydrolysing)
MCGIAGIFGAGWQKSELTCMVSSQHHRGPDARGIYIAPDGAVGLGHNRLSIIDLSAAGRQPMSSADGVLQIVFNGEIYNYLELRRELSDYPFRTRTDTEVVLAAYQRWGKACLERFIGMFAFLIWDTREQALFGARDRFGVKPLNYFLRQDGTLYVASEIGALHAAGLPAEPDPESWASYLALGLQDHSTATFWRNIYNLPAGHSMTWRSGRLKTECWYDLASRLSPEYDSRPVEDVKQEYLALLKESVALRFRSDVPVGINLSGGLDSSILLGLVHAVQGADSDVRTFTYVTGDPRYDELPWVRQMLASTRHPSIVCRIRPEEIPALAASVQDHQSEPFGGMPTLAYARVFETARQEGATVLLDGQGMDEQWAGYDYYAAELSGGAANLVQGTRQSPVRPECLIPEFRARARRLMQANPFPDRLRNRQLSDIRCTKIPRALRFNDRVSMRAATELREPFLDHRLFELSVRQPAERKIANGVRKWLLREIAGQLLPAGIVEAPKRPLQTPQREWLAGPLRDWATDHIHMALAEFRGEWLDAASILGSWDGYLAGNSDNSFYIWQWISIGLMADRSIRRRESARTYAARI